MKDYYTIKEYENGIKFYLNENNLPHRLSGPAVEWFNGDKIYDINDICYMYFDKNNNELYIYPDILKLILKYEKYIKENIKDLIQEFNTKIELKSFTIEEINEFPNWLKDLIIL